METIQAHERLATVETKVTHLERGLSEIKLAVEELKPIIWKAAGAASIILILADLFFKAPH